MRFAITHRTRYRYTRPVLLGPHVLRLRPRSDGSQRLLASRVRVQPRPAGWSECLDLDGNTVVHAWFDGLTAALAVIGTFTVETLRSNPYDFLLEPGAVLLPDGGVGDDAMLTPYRGRPEADADVTAFADAVRREVGGQTLPFLSTLSRKIAECCRPIVRVDGDPQPPGVTLRDRSGACRDLAVLFIDCCRSAGLAARFVSGYYAGAIETDRRYLHAWAEVFLPGAGWRGFDPLQGIATAEHHVAVAASARPRGAAPIDGSLHSAEAGAELEVEIRIEQQG
jgi:transglutaminase-like putative cysteine protease